MKLTISEIAERIGAEVIGDGSGIISSVAGLQSAGAADITFFKALQGYSADKQQRVDSKILTDLKESKAGAVIVSRQVDGLEKIQMVVENVDAALIKVLNIFAPKLTPPAEGVDPSAKVGKNVKIGDRASIGAFAVIENGVAIGDRSIIANGCQIGENCRIGKSCRLDSNVVVYHNCVIGNNVVIQANTTIGSVGFGYSFIDGAHRLIPHNGGVVIEDFVEIGANCCVDRAKFGNTVIGAGTKIDNLVQVAHNVVIGKCCLLAAGVGLSGSCKLGDGVVMAGHSGVADNVEIGDGVMVGAKSAVFHNIAAGKKIFGIPALDFSVESRRIAFTRRLPKMAEKLKQLGLRIKRLEASEDNQESR